MCSLLNLELVVVAQQEVMVCPFNRSQAVIIDIVAFYRKKKRMFNILVVETKSANNS